VATIKYRTPAICAAISPIEESSRASARLGVTSASSRELNPAVGLTPSRLEPTIRSNAPQARAPEHGLEFHAVVEPRPTESGPRSAAPARPLDTLAASREGDSPLLLPATNFDVAVMDILERDLERTCGRRHDARALARASCPSIEPKVRSQAAMWISQCRDYTVESNRRACRSVPAELLR